MPGEIHTETGPKIALNSRKRRAPLLRAKTIAIEKLKPLEIERMYQVFCQYYDQHSYQQFCIDLSEKNHVILLLDRKTHSIQGFSTLLQTQLQTPHAATGVFSGDTVLEKSYWGSGTLGVEFLKYLFFLKLKNPLKPVYWFLISKGYKTYLIMANNFTTHFPDHQRQTPPVFKEIIDHYYGEKFAENYRPDEGVIRYPETSCHLKHQVADIDPELLKVPRIRFFQTKNPGWQKGDELCCLAEMKLSLPFRYALKKLWKNKSR